MDLVFVNRARVDLAIGYGLPRPYSPASSSTSSAAS